MSQWLRPHFWYVVYGDPDTCREAPPPMDEYMGYTLYFLNPDSYGEPTDHFGDDEKGRWGIHCYNLAMSGCWVGLEVSHTSVPLECDNCYTLSSCTGWGTLVIIQTECNFWFPTLYNILICNDYISVLTEEGGAWLLANWLLYLVTE